MSGTAVTVGTFDGLHLGHRHLADTLCRLAAARGLDPVMITFTSHPLATLRPADAPPLLLPRNGDVMTLPGVRTEFIDFDSSVAALTSRQFMQLLKERFEARLLLTGFNNRLGSDGPADMARYVAEGREVGIEVCQATPMSLPDETVPSSSAIRRALLSGHPELASAMLGRPYSIEGVSVPGRQNGRKLGFPTINLAPSAGEVLIPAPGVYAGEIDTAAGCNLPAVINVGCNPTVSSGGKLSIEGHAIGAGLPYVYGEPVRFRFLRYLRAERRFASLDELKAAIASDVAAAIR